MCPRTAWRDHWSRVLCFFWQGPELGPQYPHWVAQTTCILVLGDCPLCTPRAWACMSYTYKYTDVHIFSTPACPNGRGKARNHSFCFSGKNGWTERDTDGSGLEQVKFTKLTLYVETVWIFIKWPDCLVVLIFAPSGYNLLLFHRRYTLEDRSPAFDGSPHSQPLHGELLTVRAAQSGWHGMTNASQLREVHWQSEKQFLSLCVACFSASLLSFKEGFESKWWVLKYQLLL